ncbi:MAG: PAS domain S-box protein [Acidobacteria bacterium]|nr:PAS domain S-box protein [Acidobacteriota bacterium]
MPSLPLPKLLRWSTARCWNSCPTGRLCSCGPAWAGRKGWWARRPWARGDLRRETRFSGPPLLRDHNVVSGLSVIIQGRERPFGVLGAHTSKRRRFTRDDVNFLQAVANLLAQTIERKRAETVLRRSESSLADAQRIAHLGNWDWDIVHNELRWSDEIHRIFGLAQQELGATYEAFLASVHPDDREFVKKSVNEAFYEKKPYNIDHRIVLPDGSERLVHERAEVTFDEAGKPTRMVGTVYDITERKRAEDALRKSEERFRRIFYDSQVGMTLTTADTRFVQVNKAFLNMLGYTEEELLGLSVSKIVHSDDWQDHLPVAEQVEKGELDFFEHEKRLLHKRGHEIWCLTSVSIIRDSTGKILFSLGQYIDLTERRKLEEQFQQAQKMEAVGRLAGGVAHDFNNLLMVMRGYTELMLGRLSANDPLRSNAEEIQKAADRATSLTQQLLAFSRKQVMQPKIFDLNAVVSDTEKMLRRLIGEDIELATILGAELGRVKADPGQIEQVILNLAVNARDAMPQGGKLVLETANVELTQAFARQHPGVTPGPHVMLAMSDTGVGMDAETQARIFEPFFTTKEKGKGTGLGLATVYGIVKQSGGYIWVYSEAGQGTTFEIYLPRVEDAVTTDQEEQVASQPPSGSETVLLVEDEEPVRKLAREFLENTGYTVLEAEDPVEAMHLSDRHQGPIHLMVTDVVMPKMSGHELAQQMASVRPEMKVLYVSGYTDDALGQYGVPTQDSFFLQKPFSLDTLARKMRTLLEGNTKTSKEETLT